MNQLIKVIEQVRKKLIFSRPESTNETIQQQYMKIPNLPKITSVKYE